MTHLECVKKWPAAYTIMAAIMDDVTVDEAEAQQKWGAQAVDIAKHRHNKAIDQRYINELIKCISRVLYVGSQMQPVAAESQQATQTVENAKLDNGQQRVPTLSPSSKPKAPTRTNSIVEGQVINLEVEETSYMGKLRRRDVMTIKENGKHHFLKGTNPANIKKHVKIGDMVRFEADEVVEPVGRDGWYKYPKNAKVLT